MKRIVAVLSSMVMALALCLPAVGTAQGQLPAKWIAAEDFNQWSFASQTPNTYTFGGTNCQVFPGVVMQPFFAFGPSSAPYPVFIRDANSTLNEIVTPISVSTTSGSCGFVASTANSHTTFAVSSGTAGLQEAVGTLKGTSGTAPWTVMLDSYWYSLVAGLPSTSAPAIIANLKGSAGVTLVDVTTVPWSFYSWNGTAYTPSASNQTVPTVAAGSGAGTSPTIAVVGTGTSGIVTLTTGTTPSGSAAIFTLTWPSIANGGFQYAPTCTITSIGTRAYTGTNATVGGPPAVDTYTSTSTALTASVSGYKWQYKCQ